MSEHETPDAAIVAMAPGPRGTPEPWTYEEESVQPPLPPVGWPWMPPPPHLTPLDRRGRRGDLHS